MPFANYKDFDDCVKQNQDKENPKTLLDISKEEKTHIGEFQGLLKMIDSEYSDELINGENEIK